MPEQKKVSLGHKLDHCLQVSQNQVELDLDLLNAWECNFLTSIRDRFLMSGSLSEKQIVILNKCYAKIQHLPFEEDEDDESLFDDRPF